MTTPVSVIGEGTEPLVNTSGVMAPPMRETEESQESKQPEPPPETNSRVNFDVRKTDIDAVLEGEPSTLHYQRLRLLERAEKRAQIEKAKPSTADIKQGPKNTISQSKMELIAGWIVKYVIAFVGNVHVNESEGAKQQLKIIETLQFICNSIDPHTMLDPPDFSMDMRVKKPSLWYRVAQGPTLVMMCLAYIVGFILSIQTWLLFFLSIAYIAITATVGVSPTEAELENATDFNLRTALVIIGLVTSILNSVGQAYAAAGLEKVSAPKFDHTTAYLVAFFSETDSKADQVRRLLGEDNLNPTDLAILAKVKAEIVEYEYEIISFFIWYSYMTSQRQLSGDSLAAISTIFTNLERERVRITTFDVVDALRWAQPTTDDAGKELPGYEHRHTNVVLLLNGSECAEFIDLLEQPFNSTSIILDETLSSVDLMSSLQHASLLSQAQKNKLMNATHKQRISNALQSRENNFVKDAVRKIENDEELSDQYRDQLMRFLPADSNLDYLV